VTRLRRFVRTPKGLVTLFLLLLAGVAARVEGPALVAPGLAAAVGAALVVDVPLSRWRCRRWMAPTGAVLTALIVAMVLSPHEAPPVFAATAAIAVASKHLVRTRAANVFNPAALGLVVSYYLFDPGQSWWGALPAIEPVAATSLLVATGAIVAHRVNRLPVVLAFLACYFVLFTGATFTGDPASAADVFVPPDLYALLFFSGFMITDPPTSPPRYRWQAACGVASAVTSFAVFTWVGAAHYLLSGALAGNLLDAWRRRRAAV
jgi:Na+-translocating ferredoxin:NAD+ oxidoreductase RnfD subunit